MAIFLKNQPPEYSNRIYCYLYFNVFMIKIALKNIETI